MRRRRLTAPRSGLVAYVVLAALLLRAYIPAGFMPASGTPFLLEPCPASMPMSMSMPMSTPMSTPMPAGHHHHSSGHGHFENCPFGSASFAGPLPSLPPLNAPACSESRPTACAEQRVFGLRVQRAHQARAPPVFLVA